jgi:hypothetical protein
MQLLGERVISIALYSGSEAFGKVIAASLSPQFVFRLIWLPTKVFSDQHAYARESAFFKAAGTTMFSLRLPEAAMLSLHFRF